MNAEKLSKRLETVVSFIPKACRIADIGSDHAYLPCYAVKHNLARSAIAGEVVEGPYKSASQQVIHANLTDKISVRKGDGLAVIESGEVDCVIIAGMGGLLITEILEKGKHKLPFVQRLILQPNVAAEKVRKWLLRNDWALTAEQIIEEDGKFYEILVADQGNGKFPYQDFDKEVLLGPYLLKEKSEVFLKKWKNELDQWEKIVGELDKADNNEKVLSKKQAIMKKIQIVKEVIG